MMGKRTSLASSSMGELMRTMPQIGEVVWIGVRPTKGAELESRKAVEATCEGGLEGDRFDGGKSRKRQVTLIQQEHLDVVAKILGQPSIDPKQTRRNLVIAGINLSALKRARFQIGSVVLEGTAVCPPCSRMELNLGRGGYNAMQGHGGLCAKVIQPGVIRVGDRVEFLELTED